MIYLQPKMANITFNTTNSTLNETTRHDSSIVIIVIVVISIFCVCCYCRESESKQRNDLKNKSIRAQNRIMIKTLN